LESKARSWVAILGVKEEVDDSDNRCRRGCCNAFRPLGNKEATNSIIANVVVVVVFRERKLMGLLDLLDLFFLFVAVALLLCAKTGLLSDDVIISNFVVVDSIRFEVVRIIIANTEGR
jgi:hypothetical protein